MNDTQNAIKTERISLFADILRDYGEVKEVTEFLEQVAATQFNDTISTIRNMATILAVDILQENASRETRIAFTVVNDFYELLNLIFCDQNDLGINSDTIEDIQTFLSQYERPPASVIPEDDEELYDNVEINAKRTLMRITQNPDLVVKTFKEHFTNIFGNESNNAQIQGVLELVEALEHFIPYVMVQLQKDGRIRSQ